MTWKKISGSVKQFAFDLSDKKEALGFQSRELLTKLAVPAEKRGEVMAKFASNAGLSADCMFFMSQRRTAQSTDCSRPSS